MGFPVQGPVDLSLIGNNKLSKWVKFGTSIDICHINLKTYLTVSPLFEVGRFAV